MHQSVKKVNFCSLVSIVFSHWKGGFEFWKWQNVLKRLKLLLKKIRRKYSNMKKVRKKACLLLTLISGKCLISHAVLLFRTHGGVHYPHALQQSLCLPPLPLQIRVILRRRRSLLLSIQLQQQERERGCFSITNTKRSNHCSLDPSSPLSSCALPLSSSSPLWSEPVVVSFSLILLLAHFCQTFCRQI